MKVGQTEQAFSRFAHPYVTNGRRLISSDRVEGTPVYRPDGEAIGKIERLMIEKRSGRVAYVVLSFGGFFGFGGRHYPLPWSMLGYNERFGGYEVDLTEEQIRGAPSYRRADEWDWNDRETGANVDRYYGVLAYWD